MTTKHTPGPWHLSAAKDCIWHQDHGRICTPPNHAQVWNWEPNARLIAAAPELLKAGEEAAGSLSAAMGILTRLGYGRTANVMQAYHDELVAAIAKAKGEQQ